MTGTSPWTSHQSLTCWTRLKPHLQSQKKIIKIGKWVGYLSGFQDQSKVQKYKKARYAIVNVSEKDLSKIIKDFEKTGKLPYEKKRPKHEPNHSYFHLVKATCEVYDEI